MRIASVVLVAAALGGCAVPTTGPVARAEGMYTITRQGNGAWVQPLELTGLATQEADAFCRKDSHKLHVIHTKEIPGGPLGRWPESELLFRCE